MIFNTSDKLLFIGDSITDCYRSGSGEALPWEPHYGVGLGFVSQIFAIVTATAPELNLRIFNKGCSGHTIRDLSSRWQTDVLDLSPQFVFIMIGTNDVWRQFDVIGRTGSELILPDEYRATLTTLVCQSQEQGSQVFLATPFFIEPNRQDAMRARMDEYCDIVREVAKREGATLIDIQAAFDRMLKSVHPARITADRIHPGPHGHMMIALEFLKAIGWELDLSS
ncbi:MAG: SGNH/GDSL hydrolase family protein [Fimbriimonadaceae bacterium]|jgi:lysophospholipase L1-like esterase|nr:SGNH/GDSL hydrolase family protein [Fimbriimonadaceae bacterium]